MNRKAYSKKQMSETSIDLKKLDEDLKSIFERIKIRYANEVEEHKKKKLQALMLYCDEKYKAFLVRMDEADKKVAACKNEHLKKRGLEFNEKTKEEFFDLLKHEIEKMERL